MSLTESKKEIKKVKRDKCKSNRLKICYKSSNHSI